MAITFINSTGATIATAASTWSLVPSSLNGGAAIVVGIGPASSGTVVSTVTDNTTNVYELVRQVPSSKPTASAELWYTLAISSLSTRISVTLSASDSGSLAMAQFTGFSTADAVKETGSSANTGATSTSYGASSITPTTNGVVVTFSRLSASTIGTLTPGANFTAWISTNTAARTFGQYWIQTTPTGTEGAFDTSSKARHATALAFFADTSAMAATDAFNRADSTDIGTNWDLVSIVGGSTNLQIVGNRLQAGAVGVTCMEALNTPAFDNDQVVECTLRSVSSAAGGAVYLLLRLTGTLSTNPSGYEADFFVPAAGETVRILRRDSGAGTLLATSSNLTWRPGDRARFTAAGSTLTLFVNGNQILTVADATYSSGRLGVGVQANVALADWEADHFAAQSSATPVGGTGAQPWTFALLGLQ